VLALLQLVTIAGISIAMIGSGKVMASLADDYQEGLPIESDISPMELAGYFTLLAVLAITLFHALFILFWRTNTISKTRLARNLRVLLYACIASILPSAIRVVENVSFAFDRKSSRDPVTGNFSFVFLSFGMQLTAVLAMLLGGWLSADISLAGNGVDGLGNFQAI
jgi:hypothetical protein